MSVWDELSPDVAAVMGDGERRKEERKLTQAQRKEKQRQRERVRMTLDMPDWLKAKLQAAADEEETSASSLGAFLLMDALRRYRRGEIDPPRVPSNSPRFAWIVDVPEDDPDDRG